MGGSEVQKPGVHMPLPAVAGFAISVGIDIAGHIVDNAHQSKREKAGRTEGTNEHGHHPDGFDHWCDYCGNEGVLAKHHDGYHSASSRMPYCRYCYPDDFPKLPSQRSM
jgi:hypothetical protein